MKVSRSVARLEMEGIWKLCAVVMCARFSSGVAEVEGQKRHWEGEGRVRSSSSSSSSSCRRCAVVSGCEGLVVSSSELSFLICVVAFVESSYSSNDIGGSEAVLRLTL